MDINTEQSPGRTLVGLSAELPTGRQQKDTFATGGIQDQPLITCSAQGPVGQMFSDGIRREEGTPLFAKVRRIAW